MAEDVLRPQGPAIGYASNKRDRYEEIFGCRRPRCPNTVRGRRGFCCARCWDELPTDTRRWLMLLASYLTQHPDDAGALVLRDEFFELAAQQWEPLPEPRRTDDPDGEVVGRRFVPRRRR